MPLFWSCLLILLLLTIAFRFQLFVSVTTITVCLKSTLQGWKTLKLSSQLQRKHLLLFYFILLQVLAQLPQNNSAAGTVSVAHIIPICFRYTSHKYFTSVQKKSPILPMRKLQLLLLLWQCPRQNIIRRKDIHGHAYWRQRHSAGQTFCTGQLCIAVGRSAESWVPKQGFSVCRKSMNNSTMLSFTHPPMQQCNAYYIIYMFCFVSDLYTVGNKTSQNSISLSLSPF